MYYLLNFTPFLINILALPLLCNYGHEIAICKFDLYDIQFTFIVFFVPIYLLVLNIIAVNKKKKKIGTCILTMCLVIFSNALLRYIDWGLSSGLLLNPDSETIMAAIYEGTVFPMLIATLGMLIFYCIRRCFLKRKQSLNER